MPGYLKASLNILQARLLLVKFTLIALEDLLTDEVAHRLNRINAVLLYVAQPSKKLSYAKGLKHLSHSSRKVELEKYNRFVVFGIPGSSTVIALFTQNTEESRRLLRYNDSLKPGSHVSILMPSVEGQLSKNGTTLITTNEPLIPLADNSVEVTLPPYDVEGSNIVFQFFSFVTKRLRIYSAVVAEACCPGSICDGQTFHDSCGCIEASSEKMWALKLEFKCPELNRMVSCDDYHKIISSQLANVFVTSSVRALNSDSDKLDRFDLDNQVQLLAADINSKQGFRVLGWFKPAQDDDGTAVEHKRFHICSILPEKVLDEDQNNLKYAVPPNHQINPIDTSGANVQNAPDVQNAPEQNDQ